MISTGTIRLETKRLILRRFQEEDIDQSFTNWTSDINSSKYFALYPHNEKRETEKMIRCWIQSYEMDTSYIWAIELKETGDVIGSISVDVTFASLETCEIAYIIGSSWWSKGYATEAMTTILNFLFTHEDFYLIEAKYNVTNTASGKLLRKLGMKQDGILRDRRMDKLTGERNDLAICSILKSEYIESM
ncbi:MAG TPA: GNAT family N-acetyltransferase [Lachnospiraceae bacterium]|nr:GNAT family N-acetyltransferase [Lachnospiraceae bacterium]